MANLAGTNVAATLLPFTDQDPFATHQAKYGKGGHRTVDTLIERNNITADRREILMSVAVIENGKEYKLITNPAGNTTSDTDWEENVGLQGPQGIQGEPGIQGIPGEKGDPGVAGQDAIIVADSISDDAIGNRTVDDSITTAYSNTNKLLPFLSMFTKRFKEIIGNASWDGIIHASLTKLWSLKWNMPFLITNPADAFTSHILPLGRNGTLSQINFYCVGTPTAATTITVKQNDVVVATASISAAGLTTWTGTITGTEDDKFQYTVTGAGLSACSLTINQKWANR